MIAVVFRLQWIGGTGRTRAERALRAARSRRAGTPQPRRRAARRIRPARQPNERWRIVMKPYLRHCRISCGGRGVSPCAVIDDRIATVLEIVLLAMVAAFLGLRLYSVLGRRAEHEEEPAVQRFESEEKPAVRPAAIPAQPVAPRPAELDGVMPAVERALRDIAAADPTFNLAQFLDGAKGAYRLILEAFWKGDRETLRELCDDDVYAGFVGAIDAREAAGETLDNTLIRIEEVRIHSAVLDGRMARIALLFVADIAAVTRDKAGAVIAGSLDDAIESRDVWTFSRNVGARDPNWLLDETDEG